MIDNTDDAGNAAPSLDLPRIHSVLSTSEMGRVHHDKGDRVDELPRGTVVKLCGIASKSSMNGMVGVVSGVVSRHRIAIVVGLQKMYLQRCSLQKFEGMTADEAWTDRAGGNVWLFAKGRADGWAALFEWLDREVLQPFEPWSDTRRLRDGRVGFTRAIAHTTISVEARTRLREPLLMAHAAFLQMGHALVQRTETLVIHSIGWSCERINRVAWTREEYRAAQDASHEFDFSAANLIAIMAVWSPILRRIFPLLPSLHLWGFGPEAPIYDRAVPGEWLHVSLRPGLYQPKSTATPDVTVAFMPAIWDGVWPRPALPVDASDCTAACTTLTGHTLDPVVVARAGSASFHDHVKLTSGELGDDHLGSRAPFAALWHGTMEALRDLGRPVLITCANVGEEQLSIRNLRSLLGPTAPIHACMSPFAMADLPGIHASVVANQTHRKYSPFVKGMRDNPAIECRLSSQGWSNFLILFNVKSSALGHAVEQ